MQPKLLNDMSNIPEWVDREAYLGFVEMRRAIRKPLTARAETIILKKLKVLRDKGHDPNQALDESTLHCWQSVFPPRLEPIPNLLYTASPQEPRMTAEEMARADDARKLAMSAIRLVRP